MTICTATSIFYCFAWIDASTFSHAKMADKKKIHLRICDGIALSDFTGDSNSAWSKIAICGSWKGHWMGPFSITPAINDQMVDHFTAQAVDVPVDYNHSSMGYSGEAPASGWLRELDARAVDGGNELWGLIDWTPRAAAQIRAREYRYLSPTIIFNTRDRKSGELSGASLHSVALTNKPFLEELPEVRLNIASIPRGEKMGELEKKIRELYGLADTVSDADVITAVATDRDVIARVSKRLGAADGSDLVAAIDHHSATESASIASEIADLRKRMLERDAIDAVTCAQREGKITADDSPLHKWAVLTATQAPEVFKNWVASAPKIVTVGEIKTPPIAPSDRALSADETRVCASLGITPETYRKYNPESEAR
jgi:phage I-like protein